MINLQKGQSVYIVPSDKRYEPFYAKVLSIGSKYITVDNIRKNENKFFIQYLCNTDGRYKLYLSKEHYEENIKAHKKRKEIISSMSSIYLLGLDYVRLCELDALIRRYIFNDK